MPYLARGGGNSLEKERERKIERKVRNYVKEKKRKLIKRSQFFFKADEKHKFKSKNEKR